MDKAIATFYEDYVKVLNATKKQYNTLKREFEKVQQEYNLNLNFIFSKHESELKTDKQKLITFHYLLTDCRLKVLVDPKDNEQQKMINEYFKINTKIRKLIKQVSDFEIQLNNTKQI